MKKENAAAIFAAVLMTLCACTQSTLPDTAPAATTQTEQAEASVSESKPAEMPAQSTPEAALSSDSFLDEPQTVQADLDEVVKLSDRIAVIYEGRIQEERKTEDFSKKELGYYMLGGVGENE